MRGGIAAVAGARLMTKAAVTGLMALVVSLAAGCVANATAQEIGTDVAGLNLCLYGDCEARGAYAADPFGMANPGTLPVGVLTYVSRGVFVSGSYFRLNAGGVGVNIESPSLTVALDPWVFQVNVVQADGEGGADSFPGVHLDLRTTMVRLAAGVDLGRTRLGLKGLSVGLLAGVPGTTSDLSGTFGGVTVADSHEDHEVGLAPGIHWRGGQGDWFNVGTFMNVERHHETQQVLDPATFTTTQRHGTSNAWFLRAGLSLVPAVPLGISKGNAPLNEWCREFRLAADVEYRNLSPLAEGTRSAQAGYFGADARVVPDAWNPLVDYLRVYVIGGVDTNGGWGIGAGLYGNGVMEFLSCNPAYSSRPLAESLGDRVDIWAATCSIAFAL